NATFSWYLNGQLLPNQQANSLVFQENGHYQCIITDAFGCLDTTNLVLIEGGLNTNTTEQPRIFPNPAKDLITITVPTHWLGAQFEICDLLGKVLYKKHLYNHKNAIPLPDFLSGNYLFRLSTQALLYQELIFVSAAH
ncbi:MAG: T9SS C-terminal target domain-containing protein, partial [Runella slithyformis]